MIGETILNSRFQQNHTGIKSNTDQIERDACAPVKLHWEGMHMVVPVLPALLMITDSRKGQNYTQQWGNKQWGRETLKRDLLSVLRCTQVSTVSIDPCNCLGFCCCRRRCSLCFLLFVFFSCAWQVKLFCAFSHYDMMEGERLITIEIEKHYILEFEVIIFLLPFENVIIYSVPHVTFNKCGNLLIGITWKPANLPS